eukprot:GEMP01082793.1.p2 GENE.GEMP01082793.1~~GEMP01082793.1.p2  ORF type:complete len:116 (+),score=27.49 GEMP01082793.1:519-866(+)
MGVVEALLDARADINHRNMTQATPLHRAVGSGHLKVTELLVSRKADVMAQDIVGESALHIAVNGHHFDLVAFFLESPHVATKKLVALENKEKKTAQALADNMPSAVRTTLKSFFE